MRIVHSAVFGRTDETSPAQRLSPLVPLPQEFHAEMVTILISLKLYTVHCNVYLVHCNVYLVHCNMYLLRVHCILNTVHCSMYLVHCSMYLVH